MSNAFQSIIGFFKIVGIFILTTLLASVGYELLGKILVPDARLTAALVILLVLVIGCIKPRSAGILSYRTFYVGLIICLPVLLIEKPNVTEEASTPSSAPKEQEVAAPVIQKKRPSQTPPRREKKADSAISRESRESVWLLQGQDSIKARLKDPNSAKFRNTFFADNVAPVACGEVNSKNSFGGYTGYKRFVTANRPDLTFIETDMPAQEFQQVWSKLCRK